MKFNSYKVYLKFLFIYFLIDSRINNVESQMLANLLASNKPLHPAASIQQTARAAALNSATLTRSDFKQPKLDKRNVWTPIPVSSELNQANQTKLQNKILKNVPTTTVTPTTTVNSITTSRPTSSKQKTKNLTNILKAKLQEGRLAKKSIVDVDIPESNLRLVFDLNNLDKLQTQSTHESQKLQKVSTNETSKTSNKSSGTKGGSKNKNNKSELKSVREQLRLLNSNGQSSVNKTAIKNPQQFQIGYIKASDLRKVINSGFTMNDVPTDISNKTETHSRERSSRLIKPGPSKIQSKTSNAKSNLEENDLESIMQKDISQKLTLEKKAVKKTMISPKQAHFGLRDKKSQNLIASNQAAGIKSLVKTNEIDNKTGSTKSTKSARQQPNNSSVKEAGTKGTKGTKGKRPVVSSRSVPFSTTMVPTTTVPTTTITTTQTPTTQAVSSSTSGKEVENEPTNEETTNPTNAETTTMLSSIISRMTSSLASFTTTSSPTTINNDKDSNLKTVATSITTLSPSEKSMPTTTTVNSDSSPTTNSPLSANLISSNDEQQKDSESLIEETNSEDESEDEENNNSLAAIAEQLNSNYGGFGTRNRLLQQPNSTKSSDSKKINNNNVAGAIMHNTKLGTDRAIVSVQPLNLKTSAFVVEDSQSTVTSNNDNEGLVDTSSKDESAKNKTPVNNKQNSEQNNDQAVNLTDNSINSNSNNEAEEEYTLINTKEVNANQQANKRLNQGVLIHRSNVIKPSKLTSSNSTHSSLRNEDSIDDYEEGFEDVNEVEIFDTSKPNNAASLLTSSGSPFLIRPFPLSATCACAPLITMNNAYSSLEAKSGSLNIGQRLRVYAKELGFENLFNKFSNVEQHLQNRLEALQLNNEGYTIFLPSDEALERLPINLIHFWQKNPDELANILDNHIIRGEPQKLNSLLESKFSKSIALNSSIIRFNHYRNDTFTANGQRVIFGDQKAPGNGILHILDGMLYPIADKNLLETLKSCNKFDGFVTLAQGTGLSDTLIQPGPFTLFVPSNEALQKIPDADLDTIRNNMTALKEFLSYHVVDGSFYSNDLRDGQFIPTLLGDHQIQVGVRVDHCLRRLIDANVSPLYRTDIPASNGVIHIVDWILKPSDHEWCENTILPR